MGLECCAVDETALQLDKLCVVTAAFCPRQRMIDIPRHVNDADPASGLQSEQSHDLSQSQNPNADMLSDLGSVENQH